MIAVGSQPGSLHKQNVTKHTRNIEYSRCFGAITAAHILSCNTSSSVEMFFFFVDPPPPSPAPRPAISLPRRHLLASSLCAHRHNVLTTTTTTTTTIIIRVTRYVTASSRHNHSDLVQPAWCSYGLGARPATAIAPDGTVFYQQTWLHTGRLSHHLDLLLNGGQSLDAEKQSDFSPKGRKNS